MQTSYQSLTHTHKSSLCLKLHNHTPHHSLSSEGYLIRAHACHSPLHLPSAYQFSTHTPNSPALFPDPPFSTIYPQLHQPYKPYPGFLMIAASFPQLSLESSPNGRPLTSPAGCSPSPVPPKKAGGPALSLLPLKELPPGLLEYFGLSLEVGKELGIICSSH